VPLLTESAFTQLYWLATTWLFTDAERRECWTCHCVNRCWSKKKCKNWVGFLIWWCTNQQLFLNWCLWEGREGNVCKFWQFARTSTQASMQNAVIDRSFLGIGMSRVRRFFLAPLTLWPVYIQTRSCMTVQYPINYSHMFPVLICQFLFQAVQFAEMWE
jgi:hypothetical protein